VILSLVAVCQIHVGRGKRYTKETYGWECPAVDMGRDDVLSLLDIMPADQIPVCVATKYGTYSENAPSLFIIAESTPWSRMTLLAAGKDAF
jgi:hypothetical protein